MKIIYIADDGKHFDNEYDCKLYEDSLKYSELINIDFYDINNNLYHIQKDDIFNWNIYQNSEKVHIHDDKEFMCFQWLANEQGYCEFQDSITSPGVWIRQDKGLGDAEWILIK